MIVLQFFYFSSPPQQILLRKVVKKIKNNLEDFGKVGQNHLILYFCAIFINPERET